MLHVTTLVENTKGEHRALECEHGLSFFIEKDGHRVLFDTGQSAALIRNARKLKVSLSRLDAVVLSHGHYDHSGGYPEVAELAPHAPLVVSERFFVEKYASAFGSYEYLGNGFDTDFLMDRKIDLAVVGPRTLEVVPGIHAVVGFPREHGEEAVNPRFVISGEDGMVPDLFEDELLLVCECGAGLVVLSGCAHPGLMNMLDEVKRRFSMPIHAVIGGTHLVEAGESRLERTVAYLDASGIPHIGVSHCTGEVAMERMAVLGDRFFHNHTGCRMAFA